MLKSFIQIFLILFFLGVHAGRSNGYKCMVKPYASMQREVMHSSFYKLMDSARHSLLVSIYTLCDKEIVHKLALARAKGVNVQVIMQQQPASLNMKKMLEKFEVPVSVFRHSEAIMHNKYVVVDDEKTWIGSMNFTDPAYKNNRESAVLIKNSGIARYYIKDFNDTLNKIEELKDNENDRKRQFRSMMHAARKKYEADVKAWQKLKKTISECKK